MHFLTRDALLQKSMEMRLRVCKQWDYLMLILYSIMPKMIFYWQSFLDIFVGVLFISEKISFIMKISNIDTFFYYMMHMPWNQYRF